ncbi:acyltransferase family protein [Nitriliruptor alkaliphilus]|uniref:acyltransferase family protein n=1 Tax=Nitriliruptor alkaliphilus TaxID=427918 RepID=UPI000696B7BB|nr:acyltransferase [Nitriliruptor alkaliphilus]
MFRVDAADVAARTPPDRDRVVDVVRLGAITMVVLGHWLVAVVLVQDGEVITGRLLDVVPATQWLTYLFQVMPLFFLVGGAVNLGSWERARGQGTPAAAWIRRRARRLLVPVVPLLALWIPLALLLGRAGLPEDEVAMATRTAFMPVWFLVVYLLAVGLVPITARLHRRFGVLIVVAAAVVATGAIDAAHRAEVPVVGFANYLLVWGGIHQLGYAWADQQLPSRRISALAMAGGAAAAIVLLVSTFGYPLSVVATETGTRSNTEPPTLVIWALALGQLGVVLAARPALRRWLQRPRMWAPIVTAGSVIITVFLWHMTAMIVVAALTHPTGLWPATDQVDATWWVFRPLWLILCGAVLAGLVAVFRRFESPPDPPPQGGRIRTVVGVVATVTGLALVLTGGLYTPERNSDLPLGALGLVLVGFGALGVLWPHSRIDGGDEGADRRRDASRQERSEHATSER